MVSSSEIEEMIVQLHRDGRTIREISKIVHKNFSYLGAVLRKRLPDEYDNNDSEKSSLETQALKLFYKGKSPAYVAIKLAMKPEDVNKLYLQYLQLEGLGSLVNIHHELGDSLPSYVQSYKKISQSGMSINRVIGVIQNQDRIPEIEKQYNELRQNVQSLCDIKFAVTGEINRLKNQILPLQNYLDSLNYRYRRSQV
jgi:hypothetical protein